MTILVVFLLAVFIIPAAYFGFIATSGSDHFSIEMISPVDGEEIISGENVTIQFNIENTGRRRGSQDISLYVNGEENYVLDDVDIPSGDKTSAEIFWDTSGLPENRYELELRPEYGNHYTINVTLIELSEVEKFLGEWEINNLPATSINIIFNEDDEGIAIEDGNEHPFTWEIDEVDRTIYISHRQFGDEGDYRFEDNHSTLVLSVDEEQVILTRVG